MIDSMFSEVMKTRPDLIFHPTIPSHYFNSTIRGNPLPRTPSIGPFANIANGSKGWAHWSGDHHKRMNQQPLYN